ncbi:CHASE2 domain-containing protein [Sphingomonas histidinilytica]|uniref:CHASE2 domain-containing protein n=1 Tax=Rhizorhabdus histidinilytica TaxID=439228 RepID=UPI001AD9B450|nr:CHASE2 domain-containing protein [Rhizorhabdus histidinilytica]MBO9375199.1 CHASE2 domain-containing protein [Rhizorhabdus histidinilytica]
MTRIRLAGLLALVAAALLSAFAGEAMRRPMFDLWQRLAPRDLSGTPVHVVLVDSDSIAAVGPWPWPRYHMARLTEEIAARGPKAIGFDMLFPEPDRVRPDIFAALYPELSPAAAAEVHGLPPMDRLYGQVVGKAPVVLGRAGVGSGGSDPAQLFVDATIKGTLPPRLPDEPRAVANIPELEGAALGHGLLNGQPDSDGRVRRVPLLMKLGGRPMPSLSLELARLARDQEAVTAEGRAVALAGRHIPVDAEGRMRLRFGRFPAAEISSAADVLRRKFPADAFAGKIVLLGLAAEGTADIVATPLEAEGFGTLVQAQAVDAILRGGWLDRPVWAAPAEWGAGLLLAVAVLLCGPARRRTLMLVPLGLAVVIAAAGWFAFDLGSLLLDPLRPLLLGGGAAVGVAGGMFVEARRERERLRETLVRERIAAAATEGELQAARSIQLGMLPPREELAGFDPRIDIDALLEPAKSIGGDLYDVIRLDADRIAFLVGDVTGKGVPAALFMALSKALAKSVVLRGVPSLADAAAILNEELMRDNSEAMNVTMLVGILDLSSGELVLMSAGHEDPLHIRGDGAIAIHKLDGGPPFCIVDFPYPDEPMRLAPGEALVLISDGVSEAQNGDGALFGHDRLLAALRGRTNASAMVEAMRDAVRAFEDGTDPTDDLTVMAVRYLGDPSETI